MDQALLIAVVVSALLGALVGLARQWTDTREHRGDIHFGGARTFTLWSILGCLAAAAGEHGGYWVLAATLLAVAVHEIAAQANLAQKRSGGTSFAAVLVTVFIGAFNGWGERNVAIVVAAATAVTLGIKRPVHTWTRSLTRDDVLAALQFLAVTGIVLPLVPNRDLGPYGGFNPYTTWLMVAFISGIGFGGYVAMRLLGPRAGIIVTSILGGIASSTATTLAFTRRSRQEPALSGPCALGVIIACTVMFPRILVIIGVVNRPLALALLPRLAVMTGPPLLVAGVLWLFHRRENRHVEDLGVKNPLSLTAALKFGALYAVIAFAVKAARAAHWGSAAFLPLSFVSGLTNMDAISLSLARSGDAPPDGLARTAAAVVVAVLGNTVLKAGVALVGGSPVLRRDVAIGLGATLAAGIVVLTVF